MNALDWATSWRIARRDLVGRFRGLRLLFLCLFLGFEFTYIIRRATNFIARHNLQLNILPINIMEKFCTFDDFYILDSALSKRAPTETSKI